jgi:xanthine dehydrogenase accessory factor
MTPTDEDRAVLTALVAWHEAGEDVALATVVETWGSSPRPCGSHMAVRVDGLFAGSVSGGCVEGAVIAAAQGVLDEGKPRLLEFGVSEDAAFTHGLSCGGKIAVLVQPVVDRMPFVRLLAAEGATLMIRLDDGFTRCVLDPADHPSRREGEWFIRPYPPPPRLVVVGAVHIAQFLAPMAAMLGFAVEVIDPRRAFARRDAFATPPVIVLPEAYFAENPPDRRTAVVSLVHAPATDDPALIAGLRSEAFYIGALGSRRTHAKRLRRLGSLGFDEAALARIKAPIGLDLGASTPAEIAVAILAEIIAARRLPS